MQTAKFELLSIGLSSFIVLRFQAFIFDNVRNTRATFKILLNIDDGAFGKLVNDLKPLSVEINSLIIDVYQESECSTDSIIKK